jgi:hypothetical protein
MRTTSTFFLALTSLALFSGCLSVQAPPPTPVPSNISTWSPLGGVSVNYALCSGQLTLTNGTGSVTDACFTDTSNVVICTDNTAPNAVRCTGESGSLFVQGAGNDVISYARLK